MQDRFFPLNLVLKYLKLS